MTWFQLTQVERTEILRRAKAIAIIGYSPKRDRPSYDIGQLLHKVSYRVYPSATVDKVLQLCQRYPHI